MFSFTTQINTLKIKGTKYYVLCWQNINLSQIYRLSQITFGNEAKVDEIFLCNWLVSFFFVVIKYDHFWTVKELNILFCVVFWTELNSLSFPWLLCYQLVFTQPSFLSFSWKTNMEMLSWEETMVSSINSVSCFNITLSIVRKIVSLHACFWRKATTTSFKKGIKLVL